MAGDGFRMDRSALRPVRRILRSADTAALDTPVPHAVLHVEVCPETCDQNLHLIIE